MSNNSLSKTISSFTNLVDMLKTYVGLDKNKCYSDDELFSSLTNNDTLSIMAEENDMSEDDIKLWLLDNMYNKVNCSIIAERGPAGGWPVVKVECSDRTFFFDWAE